ncbi:hypothetical protein [Pararhodonellum marinum]|uniref:hypothetical protein n=1 Tax=Pararhodonellum marinum TaxID=2755358 RepID=UPI00188E7EE1|nr:hypothetical protein [Pararhodonellum marinum]
MTKLALYKAMIPLMYLQIISFAVQAQSIIEVSESLKQNGKRYEVKGKGIGANMIFQFGGFAMTTVQDETANRSRKKKAFNPLKEVNVEKTSSFTMVSQEGAIASIKVGLTIYRKQRNNKSLVFNDEEKGSFNIENDPDILETSYHYTANILTNLDTGYWEVVFIEKVGQEVLGGKVFNGWLTNGDRTVQIAPVAKYEPSNKSSLMQLQLMVNNYFPGFELREKGEALAAVQTAAEKYKGYVWLADDLNPRDELLLAAVSTTILRESKRRQRAGD